MQIKRWSELVATPWKNGTGITREVLISPPDANFASIDWRISMAEVTSDGAFSSFPGLDRTLVLMAGKGMSLQYVESQQVDHLALFDNVSFAGDIPIYCMLEGGPTRDFGIMWRRDKYTVEVVVHDTDQHLVQSASMTTRVVACVHKTIAVETPDTKVCLHYGDVLCFEHEESDIDVHLEAPDARFIDVLIHAMKA